MTVIAQFETQVDHPAVDIEDGGRAKILSLDDNSEVGLFVRVQSWDETKEHKDFNQLLGKRVRVTVEILD